jgi:outer membrane lipoprotein LolB
MLALAATLGGCASVSTRTGTAVPIDIQQVSHWQAHGRLGVSGAGSGGSGSFAWEQNKDRANVQIRGPVGIGSVRLQMNGSSATPDLRLETGDGQVFQADTAWTELEARLGAPVPAGKLRYWMLGLPAPGEHEWIADPASEMPILEQDGWRIEYQYSDEFGARLPRRIRAASGDARVRIVVDRWSLDQ